MCLRKNSVRIHTVSSTELFPEFLDFTSSKVKTVVLCNIASFIPQERTVLLTTGPRLKSAIFPFGLAPFPEERARENTA